MMAGVLVEQASQGEVLLKSALKRELIEDQRPLKKKKLTTSFAIGLGGSLLGAR